MSSYTSSLPGLRLHWSAAPVPSSWEEQNAGQLCIRRHERETVAPAWIFERTFGFILHKSQAVSLEQSYFKYIVWLVIVSYIHRLTGRARGKVLLFVALWSFQDKGRPGNAIDVTFFMKRHMHVPTPKSVFSVSTYVVAIGHSQLRCNRLQTRKTNMQHYWRRLSRRCTRSLYSTLSQNLTVTWPDFYLSVVYFQWGRVIMFKPCFDSAKALGRIQSEKANYGTAKLQLARGGTHCKFSR